MMIANRVTDLSYSAIGYSTNLIAADSNLIVVRGVEDPQAAYNQMTKAVEQFFPNDGILDLDEVQVHQSVEKPAGSPKPGNLRRAPTGLSDILDNDNGQKPGGFILVIDGAALTHVSRFYLQLLYLTSNLGAGRRLQQETTASNRTTM